MCVLVIISQNSGMISYTVTALLPLPKLHYFQSVGNDTLQSRFMDSDWMKIISDTQ
jgi:hypothetical protein